MSIGSIKSGGARIGGSRPTPGQRLRAKNVSAHRAGPGWRALSRDYDQLLQGRTGRADIKVVVAPDAGGGHPGFYDPKDHRVAVEGNLLDGKAPEQLDVDNPRDFRLLSKLHGVFVHEAGHVKHTNWTIKQLRELDRGVLECTKLLEEIRMEANVINKRPSDANWIRVAAQDIILDQADPPTNEAQAAHLSVLTKGRVIAGSLKKSDLTTLTPLLDQTLGTDLTAAIDSICKRTVKVEDKDFEALVDLAKELNELIDFESELGSGVGEAISGSLADDLADAQAKALGDIEDGGQSGEIKEMAEDAQDEAAIEEQLKANENNEEEDDSHQQGGFGAVAPTIKLRQPVSSERIAMKKLTALLRRAAWRNRQLVKKTSVAPPGRLKMREALRGTAERKLGKMNSARPWQHRKRRYDVEKPVLRVGVLVDISGSMSGKVMKLSSALWILTNAIEAAGSKAGAWVFGSWSEQIIRPGSPPKLIPSLSASGGTHLVTGSINDAVDQLDLLSDGPRFLIIVSDGEWSEPEAKTRLDQLRACGVIVIQVGIDSSPYYHSADKVCVIKEPDDLVKEVGRDCIAALKEHQ